MARKTNEDKEQLAFRAILEDLLKQPANKICADCHSPAPRWASSKLGIFVCMKCSGIHRSLGTHISFVRSVTLDKWKPNEIESMQKMGNAKAATIYEAALPKDFPRPNGNDQHTLERFIRLKYEQRRFYREPTEGEVAAAPAPVQVAQAPQNFLFDPPTQTNNTPLFGGLSTTSTQPTRAQQQPQQTPNLLGDFNFPPSTQAAPAQMNVAAPKQDDFGSFVGAPSASLAPKGGVSSLSAALTPSAEQQKSNIMNLFNQPAPPPSFVAGQPYGVPGYPYAVPPGYPAPPGTVYAHAPYGYMMPGQAPGYVPPAFPAGGY